ncbi:MAG: ftsQ [Candidatus Brocadiaceae bacterium]|nr:ftsQ [Candidatus Brocadiaceae bacterium]
MLNNALSYNPLKGIFPSGMIGLKLKKALQPSLIAILLAVGLIGFVIFKIPQVWSALTDLNIFKVSPLNFEFQTPVWVTDRLRNDIKNVAALQEEYGLYEDGLTRKIAEAYCKLPVVKRVDSISRIFPNTLDVKLALRKPAAIVQYGNKSYLVDNEGVVLPNEYYLMPNPDYDSPYIRGSKLSKPPPVGSTWSDRGIAEGIELIAFLRLNNIHNLFKVVVVEVANVRKKGRSEKSEIILWTEANTQIRWGCSSLIKQTSELTNEEKLQNLLSIAKSEGTALKQMEYVDVRWDKPIGKRLVSLGSEVEER